MWRRSAAAAVAVVVLLAVGAPSHAFHDAQLPLLSSSSFTGNAWTAQRLLVPAGGGEVSFDVQGDITGHRISSFGVWVLRSTGQLMLAVTSTGWHGSFHEVHVESPAGVLVHERSGGRDGFSGLAAGTALPAGQYTAVLVATAEGSLQGTFNVYGSAGVSVGTATSGTSAFVHRETDFRGPVNVYANETFGEGTDARVKAAAGNTISKTVVGRLFGSYQSSSLDPLTVMRYTGPDGSRFGGANYFIHGGRAGTYTFQLDLNAGTTSFSGIWLMGADVTLP